MVQHPDHCLVRTVREGLQPVLLLLGPLKRVYYRFVRSKMIRLYQGRATVGTPDLVFLGINNVHASLMFREHTPAYRADKLRVRQRVSPLSWNSGLYRPHYLHPTSFSTASLYMLEYPIPVSDIPIHLAMIDKYSSTSVPYNPGS